MEIVIFFMIAVTVASSAYGIVTVSRVSGDDSVLTPFGLISKENKGVVILWFVLSAIIIIAMMIALKLSIV